ncbi:MAG TPA: c-type cytochrome [Bryobacteraceae bacterium]
MFWKLVRLLNCAASLSVFSAGVFAQPQAKATDSAAGAQIFSSRCSACHGLDGRGGEHAPNVATEPRIQSMSDAALSKIIRNGIPGAGMPGFGSSLSDTQIGAVLKELRALQRSGSNNPLTGDAARGRTLFFGKAGCSECHMVNGKGGFLAADLSGYGGRNSAEAIRQVIVDPNKNFDGRRGAVSVTTRSDRTFRGIIRNEDNFSLQMQTPDGAFHLFDKAALARVQRENKSLMPADYAARLTGGEIDDLVRFLARNYAGERSAADDDDRD